MKTVTTSFLKEINRVSWFPIRECYMLDNLGNEVEITDRVANFDRILWQIEQSYRINEFVASNCRISLKNQNEEFDIDNASNFFVTELNQSQDGFRVPVQIKCGYTLPDGTEELIPIFRGHIVDVTPTTDNDIVDIELQCISRLLRDADTDDFGDEWTDKYLYGGESHTHLNGGITTTSTSIELHNVPTGNFPSGFPQFGYVKIDDEIIYYGRWTVAPVYGFVGCLRGQLGTMREAHSDGATVYVRLADGSDTGATEEGITPSKFQFPGYPISQGSISSISSSDGNISLVESRQFLGLTATERKVTGWIDYDRGVLELAEFPTSSSSIKATFKTAYRKILFHTLVKRLLEKEGFDTSLIEDCILTDYLARRVPSSYGRVMFVDDGGTPFALPLGAKCLALCVGSDDTIYLGVDDYLVQWDGSQFNLLATLGGTDYILRLAASSDGDIFGISGDKNAGSLRNVFKWDGTTITTLSTIAAYFDPMTHSGGGQWRNFSVDDDNNIVWFLYNDGGNLGVAKINFDGTGLVEYSRPVDTDFMMDFVDIGTTIEFFYSAPSGADNILQYDSLNKGTGVWSAVGTLATISGDNPSPVDVAYHQAEDAIYLNILLVGGSNGWFVSTPAGLASPATHKTYGSAAPHISRLCGGIYHDGYIWTIEGNEYAEGSPGDNSTGSLYRIAGGILEDLGAMGLRPDGSGIIRGHAAVMDYRESDDALFFISTDLTAFNNFNFGYLFSQYGPHLATVIDIANVNGRKIWDVLSELAVLANYELGVTSEGKVFWRRRSSGVTELYGNINASVTTIPTDGTDMDSFSSFGMISIDNELIEYTGKTPNSFTGCTRGSRGSTAATHNDGAEIWEIHQVVQNLEPNQKALKFVKKLPNWDEIYNYVVVPYGDYEVAFNWNAAGETWADTSEYKYGRKTMNIGNQLLTSQDGLIAEAIGWRYYNHYNQRRSLIELETKWQPQLDVGDQISIKQGTRVILDYVSSRIRRIELDMANFITRLFAVGSSYRYEGTVYDA